jgi:hypothetical protein
MKPTLIFLVFAVCLYSCASPDKKGAPGGDSTVAQKVDTPATAAVADDSAIARRVYPSSNPKFFLEGEDLTVPSAGLEKIKSLRTKFVYIEDGESGTDSLDAKVYDSLTLREKFTYNVIHPESWAQNCDILPFQKEKASRIFGTLPNIYNEYDWSDHQMAFFKDNRDSVQAWMREQIEKDGRVGENFRELIVATNATGMIPVLAEAARKETNDHYSLTALILLMEKNQYGEYVNSSSYKKLADHSSYEHPPYLVYNKANEDLIIQRATNFYNGLAAK